MKNCTAVQVEISVNQFWSDCRLGCPLKKKGATKLPLLMMLPEMCRWASSIKASENVRLIHSFVLSLCEGYSSFSSGSESSCTYSDWTYRRQLCIVARYNNLFLIGRTLDNFALSASITIFQYIS